VTSFFGIKGAFISKTTRRICANFFSGFRRKHLFITTCIEKQWTRSLSQWLFLYPLHNFSMLSVKAEKQQIPFFKSLVWP